MPVVIKDNSAEFMDEMDKEIEEKLVKSVLVVERKAKQVCKRKTGHLARSITSVVEGDKGVTGSNVHYAPHVEMGTSKMAAQPYLRPGLLYFISQFRRIWGR